MVSLEIREKVDKVFSEDFEIAPERLVPEAHIFSDLGLDSLDVVDLIVALQKEFKIQVRDDERVREVRTLSDLYEYVALLGSEQETSG